jgi:hypothetical protein
MIGDAPPSTDYRPKKEHWRCVAPGLDHVLWLGLDASLACLSSTADQDVVSTHVL